MMNKQKSIRIMSDNTEKLKSIDEKIKQLKITIKQLDDERCNIIKNNNKYFVDIKSGDYVKISTHDSLSVIIVNKVDLHGLIRYINGYIMIQKSNSLQIITNGCYTHPIDKNFDSVTIEKITREDFIAISQGMLLDATNQRDRFMRIRE